MDTTTPPLASIGIDIGKVVFHIVGFGTDGRIAFRRKIKRLAPVETFKKLPKRIKSLVTRMVGSASFRRLQRGNQYMAVPQDNFQR